MGDFKIVGGVKVDRNAKVTTYVNKAGKPQYYKYEKNGFTVIFPQFKDGYTGSMKLNFDNPFLPRISSDASGELTLENIGGAKVYGSSAKDKIQGHCVVATEFYVNNDNNEDVVSINSTAFHLAYGKLSQDEMDYGNKIYRDTKKDKVVVGKFAALDTMLWKGFLNMITLGNAYKEEESYSVLCELNGGKELHY